MEPEKKKRKSENFYVFFVATHFITKMPADFSTSACHSFATIYMFRCTWALTSKEKYFCLVPHRGILFLALQRRLEFVLRIEIFNPLNPELNRICYLLTLLGAHHFLHVSRIKVKSLTCRLLMSYIYIYIYVYIYICVYIYIYIYGAPILDVSRSHTTTQHSR